MFSHSSSLWTKSKSNKLDRPRPPSPWTNDLADQGLAVFVVQAINFDQKTILSIPSHHIIACYYVEYDKDHIVGMKYVSAKDKASTVELIIFLLNDRHEADELCSSMDFCFRAIYITNEQNSDISKKLSLLTVSLSSTQQLRSSIGSTTSSSPSTVRSLSVASASSSSRVVVLDSSTTTTSDDASTPRRRHRRPRARHDDASPNRSSAKTTAKIIQNYLLDLQLELKNSELVEFGKLLTEWQSNQLTTKSFVKKTARLYGESRRNLLDGLHDFLPIDEQVWFLDYLDNLKTTKPSLFNSTESLEKVETL
ncbi:unnamed protein product [Adineta ricciae]|uniref:Cerebral cavernous malformations 2 harmonin-homology domain-containing protein n=1 Tax=Adineta ricciae TaxID=249248 RepID=A0A813Z1D6_ADIRI|nr:unnamed protein product [Adineta ricciae]